MNDVKDVSFPLSAQAPAGPGTRAGSRWISLGRKLTVCWQTHCLILLLLVVACFSRTLTSYFLADDFGEIAYVSHIFHGQPDLLLKNFTGNYMQIQSMSVYRPWLLMTLVFDFLIWGGNAFGYYLTNLLYFSGDVLLIYFTLRKLTSLWSPGRSSLAATSAAALFACSPLHCESISWVVGRVDAACCFYYLSSFYLFLRALSKPSRGIIASGTLCFVLALLVKEMAIGLPLLVSAAAFFFAHGADDSKSDHASLKERLFASLRFALPLWLATLAYFGMRYLALGTLLGGYTGAIGEAQSAAALSRWLDPDCFRRFLFPFAHSLFAEHCLWANWLTASYLVISAVICLRVLAGEISYKWLAFVFIWAATASAPIYRLWGIGQDLEGARFAFFLTVPVSVLLPVLLFRPARRHMSPVLEHRLLALSALSIASAILVLARTAYATNLAWVHAGKEVRAVATQAAALAKQTPLNKRILLLGIPKQHCGAHMILNGETFQFMLSSPFTDTPLAGRFLTFDPVLFGWSQSINATRFKDLLSRSDTAGAYVWTDTRRGFSALSLNCGQTNTPTYVSFPTGIVIRQKTQPSDSDTSDSQEGSLTNTWQPHAQGHATYNLAGANSICLQNILEGDGLQLSNLAINPLQYDFLELDIKSTAPLCRQTIKASWKGASDLEESCLEDRQDNACATTALEPIANESSPAGKSFRHARLRLSGYWKWFTAGTIKELTLALPAACQLEIGNIRLVAARAVAPRLTQSGATAIATGVCPILQPITMDIDASGIEGARGVKLEISRANFFFDRQAQSQQAEAVAKTIYLWQPSGKIVLSPDHFKGTGYFEIRVRALGAKGDIGEYSDSIIVLK